MSSIIPDKYKGKYKGSSDWLGEFIDDQCQLADNKGLDVEALFTLAEKNHIDVDKFRGDIDKKNAPGRLRMTIGNMLRSRARKRGGLYNNSGDWIDADESFTEGAAPVETRDGTKIVKAKADGDNGDNGDDKADGDNGDDKAAAADKGRGRRSRKETQKKAA